MKRKEGRVEGLNVAFLAVGACRRNVGKRTLENLLEGRTACPAPYFVLALCSFLSAVQGASQPADLVLGLGVSPHYSTYASGRVWHGTGRTKVFDFVQ